MKLLTITASALLAACGNSSAEAPAASPTPDRPSTPPRTRPAPAPAPDLGSCRIEGSGAVTFENTRRGGRSAINTWHWVTTEQERANVAQFILNCGGKDVSFSVMPGKTEIPFGPKQYLFDHATKRADLRLLISVGKDLFVKERGTIEITAFDGKHLAGTFDLVGQLSASGKEQRLQGSFDYACPGYSGCAK